MRYENLTKWILIAISCRIDVVLEPVLPKSAETSKVECFIKSRCVNKKFTLTAPIKIKRLSEY